MRVCLLVMRCTRVAREVHLQGGRFDEAESWRVAIVAAPPGSLRNSFAFCSNIIFN